MLQWCDNFGSYGSTTSYMTNGLYAAVTGSVSLVSDPDPGSSGTVLKTDDTVNASPPYLGSYVRKVLSSAQGTCGCALRLWLSALPPHTGSEIVPITFSDTNNVAHISLRVNTDGTISVYRGAIEVGTLLGTTSSPVITANAWSHIECKVTISDTVGEVEIRVNSATVYTLTGADTKNSSAATVSQLSIGSNRLIGGTGAPDCYTKDLVIWDSTGSHNNDFLGSVHVVRLTPDADTSLNWTPSTGSTGFDLINESPPDDADYIAADDSPPSPATMTLTDLPDDVTAVKGLMTLVRAVKTDGGDAQLMVSLKSGSDLADGADRAITVAETYWYDFSEEDPATDAQWAPAAVDAASIVFDRTV